MGANLHRIFATETRHRIKTLILVHNSRFPYRMTGAACPMDTGENAYRSATDPLAYQGVEEPPV